jgi:16S rRNA (guanine527-N7)-methyltransferase
LGGLIAGAPLNLVARGERERVRDRHIEEALALAPLLEVADGQRWLDLGTGGGLPGLVLAILHPRASFTLIDATRKKVQAVQRFVEELGLANVEAYAARAEVLAHDRAHRGTYDGVVSRAVAGLATVIELSRGFLRPGGRIVAVKGPHVQEEVTAATPALRRLRVGDPLLRTVPTAPRPTVLVTMTAKGAPPGGIPRADGLPRAAPLGARSRPPPRSRLEQASKQSSKQGRSPREPS